ncbi:hypothetical protein Btru_043296, partial [Bulinus truncatus]
LTGGLTHIDRQNSLKQTISSYGSSQSTNMMAICFIILCVGDQIAIDEIDWWEARYERWSVLSNTPSPPPRGNDAECVTPPHVLVYQPTTRIGLSVHHTYWSISPPRVLVYQPTTRIALLVYHFIIRLALSPAAPCRPIIDIPQCARNSHTVVLAVAPPTDSDIIDHYEVAYGTKEQKYLQMEVREHVMVTPKRLALIGHNFGPMRDELWFCILC